MQKPSGGVTTQVDKVATRGSRLELVQEEKGIYSQQNNFSLGQISKLYWGKQDEQIYNLGLADTDNVIILPDGSVTRRPPFIFWRWVEASGDKQTTAPFYLKKDADVISNTRWLQYYPEKILITVRDSASSHQVFEEMRYIKERIQPKITPDLITISKTTSIDNEDKEDIDVSKEDFESIYQEEASQIDYTESASYSSNRVIPFYQKKAECFAIVLSHKKMVIYDLAKRVKECCVIKNFDWKQKYLINAKYLQVRNSIYIFNPFEDNIFVLKYTSDDDTWIVKIFDVNNLSSPSLSTIISKIENAAKVASGQRKNICTKAAEHIKNEKGKPYIPNAIVYFQDRLWYIGINYKPNSILASGVSNYSKLSIYWGIDCLTNEETPEEYKGARAPLYYNLIMDKYDNILWATEFEGAILIGTCNKIYSISGSSTNPVISGANINVREFATLGSAQIEPCKAGHSLFIVSQDRRKIFELEKSGASSKITDLTTYCDFFLGEHRIKKFVIQRSPFTIFWVINDIGQLFSLTYSKGDNVAGWVCHSIGGEGLIEDIDIIMKKDVETLTAIIRRSTVCSLEYLDSVQLMSQTHADYRGYYLDSKIDGEELASMITNCDDERFTYNVSCYYGLIKSATYFWLDEIVEQKLVKGDYCGYPYYSRVTTLPLINPVTEEKLGGKAVNLQYIRFFYFSSILDGKLIAFSNEEALIDSEIEFVTSTELIKLAGVDLLIDGTKITYHETSTSNKQLKLMLGNHKNVQIRFILTGPYPFTLLNVHYFYKVRKE